ncbi:TIGR00730 family Rossman fold protein [Patulibacter brassicae]|uniref:Cytokinin riboside 5'-monophosphate phosphoribohydrolase n=1 Tax=Patulibacter brassicae TaxID=1705717 RepID=A0ABU4VI38_9ACTN|nr:TIGR00730 family Rossman fold protein [Patulibacter brassicae]MDX8151349.1 TIGR00730 family Rossman fold protein [Patulibacter brassicae]
MSEAPRPHHPDNPDEELLNADLGEVVVELSDEERLDRIRAELSRAFTALRDVRRGITVFGSARLGPGTPEYERTVELGRRLAADAGATVVTGGGPGLMEAANRGAQDGGGRTVGLLIDLPFETHGNPYLDLAIEFHYFFTRKVAFVRYSGAFVATPGGFGTMDELFEVLCLVQTQKIRRYPVVLWGTAYWGGLVEWLRERMLADGLISDGDERLFRVTDDVDEIVAICRAAADVREAGGPGDLHGAMGEDWPPGLWRR